MNLVRRGWMALVIPVIAGSSVIPATAAFAQEQAEQRYIAEFQPGTQRSEQASLITSEQGRTVREVDRSFRAVLMTPQAAARLARRHQVRSVETDAIMKADFAPNDPCFSGCSIGSQWGVKRVGAPAAWDTVPGGTVDLRVAVLDTGVDPTHPELAGRVTLEANLSDSPSASDLNGHGTAVAGVLAATGNNSSGIAGLGWAIQVLSYKVLNDSGNGYTSNIAAGIRAAADAGAKVINLSLSGPHSTLVLETAVQYASASSVVVAAAGNEGSTSPTYPAAYADAIGVAATRADDSRASFSNYGSWVDLSAPGVDIEATLAGGGYGLRSGTSFSSPIVAGIAALVWKSPHGLDAATVRNRMLSTAQVLSIAGMGEGIADASAAVSDAAGRARSISSTPAWSPWSSLGGIVSSAPDTVADSFGNLMVLARGSDNALWVRELVGTNWSGWTSLGGILSSDPAAVSSENGSIEIFVRGGDGALWQKTRSGGAWSGWSSLGGKLSSDPSAASPSSDKIAVFARGGDGALWQKSRVSGSWSGWSSLGGLLSSSPDVSSRGGGTLDVFAAGGDDALWMRSFDGSSWNSWASLGGRLSSDPAAVSWASDRIDVFARGGDGALWQRSWAGSWSGWSSLGGVLNSNPAAASRSRSSLDVLVAGADNALWLRSFTPA